MRSRLTLIDTTVPGSTGYPEIYVLNPLIIKDCDRQSIPSPAIPTWINMPPRNKKNNTHGTRSNSKSRNDQQGAPPAEPNAPGTTSTGCAAASNTRVGADPSSNQNNREVKDSKSAVSQKPTSPQLTDMDKTSEVSNNSKNIPGGSHKENLCYEIEHSKEPGHGHSLAVSDNREVSIQTDFPPDFKGLFTQDSPIMAMFEELKTIRIKLDAVEKIETTTSSLAEQFKTITERTTKLEVSTKSNTKLIQEIKVETSAVKEDVKGIIESNDAKFKEVNAEMASLKKTLELQGRAIAELTTLKTDLLKQNKEVKSDLIKQNQEMKDEQIKRNKTQTGEINKLIEQQKQQVDSFKATTKRVEEKILEKTEEKIEEKVGKVSQDISFKKLKDQAFANRYNIIITGLKEDPGKSVRTAVTDLLKSLGEEKLALSEVFRIGTPRNDTTYSRPVKVIFEQLVDRNRVWWKRGNIQAEDGERQIKIQADLPKELRDETNILYRVKRAATKIKKFKSATIRNFAVLLHGKEYGPGNLEDLPFQLTPSYISNPRSETALAFFSKYSVLSNHHPSPFSLQGEEFHNMEHYLALTKARLSGQENIIQRASQATDPKVAKAILHSLREDHPAEWDQQVEKVTMDGLRAKFSQNKHLLAFLKGTEQLQIGKPHQTLDGESG